MLISTNDLFSTMINSRVFSWDWVPWGDYRASCWCQRGTFSNALCIYHKQQIHWWWQYLHKLLGYRKKHVLWSNKVYVTCFFHQDNFPRWNFWSLNAVPRSKNLCFKLTVQQSYDFNVTTTKLPKTLSVFNLKKHFPESLSQNSL